MRVLFVDDEPNVVRSAVDYLTRYGFEVETATNGVEALAKIQENSPDMLVSDVMMPVMGGFELLRNLRQDARFNNIKILFLTNCSPTSPRLCYEKHPSPFALGVDASLLKPFSFYELIFAVNDVAGVKQPDAIAAAIAPKNTMIEN